MKVLTLTQPWASLVIHGLKLVETRSWNTHYRGWLGIHAAKGFPNWARDICLTPYFATALELIEETADTLPRGVILGEALLHSTYVITRPPPTKTEEVFGDYTPGRFGWIFERVYRYPSTIPAKGALGLWDWQEQKTKENQNA